MQSVGSNIMSPMPGNSALISPRDDGVTMDDIRMQQ